MHTAKTSPKNFSVDVNPFKTVVYKNIAKDNVLALYADDRDSGEFKPFSELKPGNIKLVNIC